MIRIKLWYDLRARFYASFLFFVVIATAHVMIFPVVRTTLGEWESDLPGLQTEETRRLAEDFTYYTGSRWFGEIERTALFGILLAVGGVFAEGRTRSIPVTLSLPVHRSTWVLAQTAASILAIFLLNVAATLVLFAGGFLIGQPLPAQQILLGALLLTVSCAPYVAAAVLASVYTGERLIAGMAAITFLIVTNKLDFFTSLQPWLPESLTNILTGEGYLWQPLVPIVVFTTAFLAGAIIEFRKKDY